MLNVEELSREQLDELKLDYFWELADDGELGDYENRDDIPDSVLFERYEGVIFTNDDFSCTAGMF